MSSTIVTQLKHFTSMGLAIGLPLAVVLSPSKLDMVIDLGLIAVLPIHVHMGFAAVVTDYAPHVLPRFMTPVLQVSLVGLTGLMVLGLLHMAIFGNGIVGTVKKVWVAQPKE